MIQMFGFSPLCCLIFSTCQIHLCDCQDDIVKVDWECCTGCFCLDFLHCVDWFVSTCQIHLSSPLPISSRQSQKALRLSRWYSQGWRGRENCNKATKPGLSDFDFVISHLIGICPKPFRRFLCFFLEIIDVTFCKFRPHVRWWRGGNFACNEVFVVIVRIGRGLAF